MKKVAFVANSEWYLDNFRKSTIEYFLSKHVQVFCLYPKNGDGELSDLGVRHVKFTMSPAGTSLYFELFSFICVFLSILRVRPDVLFSFNPKTNLYSLICCWVLRVKCVVNVSGLGAASQLSGIKGFFYRQLSSFFYRKASYIFFQNSDDYHQLNKAGVIKVGAADVIPGSGVDLNRFHPVARPEAETTFLMAARLITQKGVYEYVEAAKNLNGECCSFLLAGVPDSSERAVDANFIKNLDGSEGVKFLGHVRDMPSLLTKVDCVVLPSYYPEGIPKVLIEALSSGKIIITTNTPGCRETVDDEVNGYLVSPRCSASLATAMLKVCRLGEKDKKEMMNRSRRLAEEKYDENIVIGKYWRLFEVLSD
ncbi:glycosyltransferase family 4 protein [Alloalcanivorax marinus]|uniref:glycosyltransferase family 4 protein n=1 Tax=Alloalcanivorax marinus TaxID=1177169 RepID=UPI00195EDBA4|nr:glycosyltransferase family 4 protein [Alloalcanivorax marinus]MBM7333641.1 glycosyltransferase family 4 protein [Alloalcanivorax marinus]